MDMLRHPNNPSLDPDPDACLGDKFVGPNTKDFGVQLVISLSLGLSAFLTFCFLRPRWKSLYAARRRHCDPFLGLPALPDSFFGWMPVLYRITEQQVLSSAGLDGYVFLAFFKMSMRLLAIMFFFAVAVLKPIHDHFVERPPPNNGTASFLFPNHFTYHGEDNDPRDPKTPGDDDDDISFNKNMGYLWSYLIFTYLFTALTLYMMNKETLKVIRVRQSYLGTQSTITDRTFRLSGIPRELRSEEAIKDLVQKLEIGKVESVTLCRDWRLLDKLIKERKKVLGRLEEAWSQYLADKPTARTASSPPGGSGGDGLINGAGSGEQDAADEEAGESDRLIRSGAAELRPRRRPQTRFWYGFLRLQSRKTDAIDYYSEKLRRLDDQILAARRRTYEPTDLAFVTMDSIAACQMAIQALIDPHPGRLLTKPAPAPSDIVWENTYASSFSRRFRSWSVTIFVTALSIVWLVPLGFIAGLLSICTIDKFLPNFGDWLKEHDIWRSLFQTGLPTAAVSLLNVAVPYLYDWLSYKQGALSRGDIVLSAISKNFLFTFFNIFLILTVFGAVTSILDVLRNSLRDTTYIAYTLARQLERFSAFYTNFIMLQGLGLFPFRLLQFGAVAQYPFQRLLARTPRERAQVAQPNMFYYGFYLPTAMLVFILCLAYSVIPGGFLVLGLGLAYFSLGYFTYKYQLLYAMDQPQHATGGAWRMVCYRIVLGLAVFHLTMSGYLALRKAWIISGLITPLFIGTLAYAWVFRRRVEPLTHFIALRSIDPKESARRRRPRIASNEDEISESAILDGDEDVRGALQRRDTGGIFRRGSTVDEDREKGARFVNPSLVVPLEQPWIYEEAPPPLIPSSQGSDDSSSDLLIPGGTGIANSGGIPGGFGFGSSPGYASSPDALGRHHHRRRRDLSTGPASSDNSESEVSLGDTHVWRDA
ncbi:hypothetical protein VTJ83DRAFT_761 [Remersonia thermophila]|uniref:DUF221-domain-containing protein n=1 Tax=Remersonia thermophila TaxID=72144 RepID=A0ABR4DLZ4_9PEZI